MFSGRNAPIKWPGRYKTGFWVGGISLAAVGVLWFSSRPARSSLPSPLPPILNPDLILRGSFTRGLPLYDILRKVALSPQQAGQIAEILKNDIDPRTLRAEDKFQIARSQDGRFKNLIVVRGLKRYVVEPADGAFRLKTEDVPVSVEEKSAAGRLKGSLWISMKEQGLDAQTIMAFADIFAWNVDFLTEPRDGDSFALAWRRKSLPDGESAGVEIISALYNGKETGKQTACLFNGEYFDDDGYSLRRAFLHAPLNFRRISSGFTRQRFHPIFRVYRPHLGIDYAAPTGTPVVSIGDGVVIFKGWKTGFGNFVQVRHNGTYTTCYGHFSRFASGLRAGMRVRQGQVVGYVGQTGHATGPHLDFRITKNGSFVNFLKLKFPADKRVDSKLRTEFKETAGRELTKLERLFAPAALAAKT